MPAAARRDQLIEVARGLFADRGYDGTSVEEIAARALVSKPAVYEHFGGKDGLYSAVVEREIEILLGLMQESLTVGAGRRVLESAARALFDYIEARPDGFRIVVRDRPLDSGEGSFQSIIGDVATRIAGLLALDFERHGLDPRMAPLYSQMLIGMGSQVGLWWLDRPELDRRIVAAHLVNMAWNGLSGLETRPRITDRSPD